MTTWTKEATDTTISSTATGQITASSLNVDSGTLYVDSSQAGVGPSSLSTPSDSNVRLQALAINAGPTVQASAVSPNSPSFDLREIGGGAKQAVFGLALDAGDYSDSSVDGDAVIRTAGKLIFSTDSSSGWTSEMALSSGSIGIGTLSPDKRLEIFDSSNAQLRLTNTDATDYADFEVDSSGDLTITMESNGQLKLAGGGSKVTGTPTSQSDCMKISVDGVDRFIKLYSSPPGGG